MMHPLATEGGSSTLTIQRIKQTNLSSNVRKLMVPKWLNKRRLESLVVRKTKPESLL
jgi:hypothetical protein